MGKRVYGVLAAAALAVLVTFSGLGAQESAAAPVPQAPGVAATGQVKPGAAAAQQPTPPPGPTLDPEKSERANSERAQNKTVVGIIAGVLLLIVLWGRRVRGKRNKQIKAAAKGK